MVPAARRPLVLDLLGQTARDPSAFSLIVVNLITIELALLERWQLAHVMRIYWWQSVIIGAFHFVRLLMLKHSHMEGPDESGGTSETTAGERIMTAVVFALIYGTMHVAYMRFIRELPAEQLNDPLLLTVAIVAFGVNHLFSFLRNIEVDAHKWRSFPAMVRLAHWRVLPMHATVMLGAWLEPTHVGAAFFLALKTIADVVMHDVKHLMRADPPSPRRARRSE